MTDEAEKVWLINTYLIFTKILILKNKHFTMDK